MNTRRQREALMPVAMLTAVFTLHWAWQTCVLYLPSEGTLAGAPSPWYLSNVLGLLAYTLATLAAPRLQRYVQTPVFRCLAALLLVASGAVKAAGVLWVQSTPAMLAAAAALSVAGGALLTVGRFDLLCRLSRGSERMAVLLIATIAQMILFLLVRSLPVVVSWAFILAMPAAISACMGRAAASLGPVASTALRDESPARHDSASAGLPAAQLLTFFLLALSINFIRATVESQGGYADHTVDVVGLTTLITVIFAALELALEREEAGRVAPFATVVSITTAVVVLLVDESHAQYASAFVSAGFYVFVALFWQRTSRYADTRPDATVYVAALTHVVYTAGLFSGQLVFRALGSLEGAGMSGPLLVIADVALAAAFVLFIRDTLAKNDPDSKIYLAPGLVGTIEADCELIARKYGLTEKERLAVVDLACGKSLKIAAQTRFVSENTVKTHVAHAYRKTGVHSREELMELICAVDLERVALREME